MQTIQSLPVAIIGGGPVGLAAAAHLTVRGMPFMLFESGNAVGANVLLWRHVRVFSPWRYNVDKAARQLLETSGWQHPDEDALPTGEELYLNYFEPFAALDAIGPSIRVKSKVLAVGRKNQDKLKTKGRDTLPYVLHVLHEDNRISQYEARAVIDASGTWNSPNPIGSGGIFAVGELENSRQIFYGIPDVLGEHRERYKNKNILVVGAGHSAINTILELDKLKDEHPGTQINWVLRKKYVSEVYGGQEADALPARGALGIRIEQLVNDDRVNVYTPFQIHQVVKQGRQLAVVGHQHDELGMLGGIDEIISNTGSRPDFSFLREVRLSADPALESVAEIAELIDPNIHSCGTVRPHGERELRQPDKDFYVVGSKSYGRAPTFLMATGYEQVRSVVAALAGDWEAASNVELDLPETGVCSVSSGGESDGAACCGPAPAAKTEEKVVASACCG
ncbi:MAG: NAD(P)-binding domain-containing protein [Imperialibacter sp.]|uniref:NAD(P)-binding domain-containing protein n=1 Tax=Imperialibacter sp. TaxID=2038411 RepID=UPI0032EBCF71